MKRNKQKRGFLALLISILMLFTLAPAAFAEGEAELTAVEAATVDELLKAIAPNTVITLTGQSYNLTEARGYGVYGSQYYGWNEVYDDGWELEIDNVQNLTIRAAQPGVEIVTVPRYACVLRFVNCREITLEGFTAGHTVAPGYCTGSVLGFERCRNVQVESCDLYGCGTYGLELFSCNDLYAHNTVIRDCSYGAVYADSTAGLLLDACEIYGINGIGGLFMLSSCRNCAVINSTVRDCGAGSLTDFSAVKSFNFSGCSIRNNRFDGMFYSTLYGIVVTDCEFLDNTVYNGWYLDSWQRSERVVNQDGEMISDEELRSMERHTVDGWSLPEEPVFSATAPEVSEDGMIHVHTVDELLASIAPNAKIYLEDGVYDLSEATSYGYTGGEYWYWMSCYDGPGLVISNVENLTITAAGPHRAGIMAQPRYADVLAFENCKNVTLKNFTAGHSQSPSECAGGVLNFMDTDNIVIEDCSLYGCGILGVRGTNCGNMEVRYTEIHHCSYGAFQLMMCHDVNIVHCNVHDIPGELYQVYDSQNITLDGEALPSGSGW